MVLDSALRNALAKLISCEVTQEELISQLPRTAIASHLCRLQSLLGILFATGTISERMYWGKTYLGEFEATSKWCTICPAFRPRASQLHLSRFAIFRREQNGSFLLESPRALGRMILPEKDLPKTIAAITAPRSTMQTRLFRQYLYERDFLVNSFENDEEVAPLKYWEPHDLNFHAASRDGRHGGRSGGTYRFATTDPPPPATFTVQGLAAIDLSAMIPLHEPSGNKTFGDVIDLRRSTRKYSKAPITNIELAHFLRQTNGVRKTLRGIKVPTGSGDVEMDFNLRSHPSGGALYETNLFVVVNRCEGIAQGLYFYDGLKHRLLLLRKWDDACETLVRKAEWAAQVSQGNVQVLIILAAHFQRMQWKYERACYAAMLKNAGAIIAYMYLIAADMNLACCANGQGDSDLFEAATGIDYFECGSIAEFILGKAESLD